MAAGQNSITPTTPKAVHVKLAMNSRGIAVPSFEISNPIDDPASSAKDLAKGRTIIVEDDMASGNEGRMTPLASRSVSGSSAPTDPSHSSPNSTSISSNSSQAVPSAKPVFNSLPFVPARVGLCNIQGEEQLKMALQGKDRYFLMFLSKEIEAFIRQVVLGNAPSAALAVPVATASTSLLAGASFKMGISASSTYQRMLVYKAAEWYGLKAVSTGDGTMFIGVLGNLPENSARLSLSELAPTPKEAPQKFQLMRRTQNTDDSARSNDTGEDSSEASRQTFEQRTAAYAAARERILGNANDEEDINENLKAMVEDEVRGRSRRQDSDEPDPIPRHTLGATMPAPYEPVYASLYHPPVEETPPSVPPPPVDTSAEGYSYLTGHTYPLYPEQNYVHPTADMYAAHGPLYSMGYGSQVYVPPMSYMAPPDVAAWQQQSANSMPSPPVVTHMPRSPMMAPPQMMPTHQGWGYPQMHNHAGNQSRQMPMIPQGMQYAQYPTYPPNVMYGHLHQPIPSRPHPQHHSSASSSISSRSYQEYSYQDYSRPHSRGSTTSTRSAPAPSSVRMGAMYPAGAGPSHRQAGIRGQGANNMTSLGFRSERTSQRGHSPSSVTTTSSRSSRKTTSIILAQPSQHPLPQRPDWAANNIPYRPAAMIESDPGPDTAEFPPLRQVVHAEPMQFERARTKTITAPNQTVWNGSASKALANGAATLPGSPQSARSPQLGPPWKSSAPVQHTPVAIISAAHVRAATSPQETDASRQVPIARQPGTAPEPSLAKALSRPQSAAARSVTPAVTAADDIEAKLAAVSLNVGITIGPQPSPKSSGSNGVMGTPSYAKIVRRD